jgi:glycosyltransferase involved in cell wall biosynthesis
MTAPDDRPDVSVCVATYQGAAYVTEQLRSVLDQLGPGDELVVVDDASRDDTVARVRALDDDRVRLVASPVNRGYVRTFEHALGLARGRVLLLADQDDVWAPGRLAAMVAALSGPGAADVVATNLATLGGPDRIRGPYGQADWHLRAAASGHRVRNVLGVLAGNRPYYGCAMGLRREALATVLPFPAFLDESHDLWIALYGNVAGRMRHLELRSVLRRYHADNASPDRPRGVLPALRSRAMLVRATAELLRRRLRAGRRAGAAS